jgi:hypothetical protein
MKDPEPIQMPWNSRGFLAGEAGSRWQNTLRVALLPPQRSHPAGGLHVFDGSLKRRDSGELNRLCYDGQPRTAGRIQCGRAADSFRRSGRLFFFC